MLACEALKNAKTVVIKIGTALVIAQNGQHVRQDWLDALAADIKVLRDASKNIVIVSSGAVALGRNAIGISLKLAPSSIPLEKKQASSAVGQFHLLQGYHRSFEKQGLNIAQVLLTMAETENRRTHLNARATLHELLEQGIVPVINENDAISTEEIRFGDNDRLAARVAQMIDAQAVVLFSTIDGLYDDNPHKNPKARHIPVVEKIGAAELAMADEAVPGLSTGGMKSKLEAALAANSAGIDLMIADGQVSHCLRAIFEDQETRTTLFKASKQQKNSKKRWIGAHLKPKGAFIVDSGAIKALQSGKSLLPVGVKNVEGSFERGDIVEISNEAGKRLGLGISAYNAQDALKIKGQGSESITKALGYAGRAELIHRNDMVLND